MRNRRRASVARYPVPSVGLAIAARRARLGTQEALLGVPVVTRSFAASALAFAPVYLANLVLAQRFAGVETATRAFAANLLGAMVGGTLEYLSLITGYQFLSILVGVLYSLAFITGRRRLAAQRPAGPSAGMRRRQLIAPIVSAINR